MNGVITKISKELLWRRYPRQKDNAGILDFLAAIAYKQMTDDAFFNDEKYYKIEERQEINIYLGVKRHKVIVPFVEPTELLFLNVGRLYQTYTRYKRLKSETPLQRPHISRLLSDLESFIGYNVCSVFRYSWWSIHEDGSLQTNRGGSYVFNHKNFQLETLLLFPKPNLIS